MMDKKQFETPNLQVMEFSVEDIITTSENGCEFDAGDF